MFFRKAKRIKQLEIENEALRRTFDHFKKFPPIIKTTTREIATYRVKKIISADIGEKYRDDLIKESLADELSNKCPFITIGREYDPKTDCYIMSASIDIVAKEI